MKCASEMHSDFNMVAQMRKFVGTIYFSTFCFAYFHLLLQLGALYVDQLEFSDHHIFQLKVQLSFMLLKGIY